MSARARLNFCEVFELARGIIRKPSFRKIIGAYRSQFIRSILRLFFPFSYGKKGSGWWTDPKKAAYNWWYHRTSISAYELVGGRPKRSSKGAMFFALSVAFVISLFMFPYDAAKACNTGRKIKKERAKRQRGEGRRSKGQSAKTGSRKPKTESKTANSSSPSSPRSHAEAPSGNIEATQSAPRQPKEHTVRSDNTDGQISQANDKEVTRSERIEEYYAGLKTPTVHTEVKEAPTKSDPDAPKSAPLNEKDRYVKKRMVISEEERGDRDALSTLNIGARIDMAVDPDHPTSKNAVALFFEDKKIGYVSRDDELPIAMSLKMNRKMYGLITDVIDRDGKKTFEYEVWFSTR